MLTSQITSRIAFRNQGQEWMTDRRIIKRGMSELAKVDQDIARALAQIGLPELRLRPVRETTG